MRVFNDTYGSKPDLLSAQAFEAMELVNFAIENVSSNDRVELLRQLSVLKDFESVLGTITVDRNRVVNRNLPIVTMERGGNFVEQ